MRRLILIMGGLAVAAIAYWLISPLFMTERVDERLEDIPGAAQGAAMQSPGAPPAAADPTLAAPPPSATAPSPMTPAVTTVDQGTFVGLTGHSGRGTVKRLNIAGKYYIRFEDDFHVTNGPDLFVHFGRNGEYAAEARIASLKGNEGGQNYEVPAGINPSQYDEVWVWCRAFSVPFAKAELR